MAYVQLLNSEVKVKIWMIIYVDNTCMHNTSSGQGTELPRPPEQHRASICFSMEVEMNGRLLIPGCAIHYNATPVIPSQLQFINSPYNGLVSRLCFPSPLAQRPVVVRTLHSRAQATSSSVLGKGKETGCIRQVLTTNG